MKPGVLIVISLCIFSTSCFDDGSRKSFWEKGYWEGYEEAKEGLGKNSIHYGPDLDGTKSKLKIAWEAYRTGWTDFKAGRPYNSKMPAK